MGTFGQRLKREREMRGIGLEEIATSSKIGIRMLRALEDERFDLLPGGIFNKGFVRAYAKHVGIDEEQAVADFLVATGEATAASVELEQEARPEPSRALRWLIVVAVLVVLAGVAFAVWKRYGGRVTAPGGAAVLSYVYTPFPFPSSEIILSHVRKQGSRSVDQVVRVAANPGFRRTGPRCVGPPVPESLQLGAPERVYRKYSLSLCQGNVSSVGIVGHVVAG